MIIKDSCTALNREEICHAVNGYFVYKVNPTFFPIPEFFITHLGVYDLFYVMWGKSIKKTPFKKVEF